jgi:hypothetical protein
VAVLTVFPSFIASLAGHTMPRITPQRAIHPAARRESEPPRKLIQGVP